MTQPKTAFISGAGRNIGRAIALHLVSQGVNVVVNGSSDRAACEAVAAEAEARGAVALVAVGVTADVEYMASAALDRFGRIDIVVDKAAIRRPPLSTQTQSDSQFSFLRRLTKLSPAKPRPMSAMALGAGTSFVSDTKTGPAQAVRVAI